MEKKTLRWIQQSLLMVICLTVFGWSGCKSQTEPDLLPGHWKVIHIDRGGEQYGGEWFRGTSYHFRENGVVFTENFNGDTLSSRYTRQGDTLTYLNPGGNEQYHIDSLTSTRLVISAELQGIPTVVTMLREKPEAPE